MEAPTHQLPRTSPDPMMIMNIATNRAKQQGLDYMAMAKELGGQQISIRYGPYDHTQPSQEETDYIHLPLFATMSTIFMNTLGYINPNTKPTVYAPDSITMENLKYYMYTHQLPIAISTPQLINLYKMADFYAIDVLMGVIEVVLHSSTTFKHTIPIISLAHQHNLSSLYTQQTRYIHTHPIRVFANTNALSIHPKLMKLIVNYPLNIHEIDLATSVYQWAIKWAQETNLPLDTLLRPLILGIRYPIIHQALIDSEFPDVKSQFHPMYYHGAPQLVHPRTIRPSYQTLPPNSLAYIHP